MSAPSEIRLKRAEQAIEIAWPDGARYRLPAEYVRVESPSAEVQGHGPGQKVIIAGRRHVGILRVEAVGNYAVRIVFDDLHDTGIYSWETLYDLGRNYEPYWEAYLHALKDAGHERKGAE